MSKNKIRKESENTLIKQFNIKKLIRQTKRHNISSTSSDNNSFVNFS